MIARIQRLWLRHPALLVAALVLTGSVGVVAGVRFANRTPSIPTASVERGEFIDTFQIRGEIKALRSLTLSAPAEAGDLQIVRIATDGAQLKKGDAAVEFDKSKTEQDVAQYQSAMKSAQAEIDQARAQSRLTEEEDLTAVMKAKYDLESAKLEAGKQEIVSAIEGEKARLKVTDAEQKLRETENKQKADRAGNKAAIDTKIQNSKKAMFDVERAQRALGEMTLRAPADGIVSLGQLWGPDGRAAFKPGDAAWPGAPIAEFPDVSTLRAVARIGETERGRLQVGQTVNVQFEAIPDRQLSGHIEQIGTIASMDFSGGWPFPRNFTVQVLLDQSDARIRPGMSAQLSVVVDRVADALTIPVQCAFQKSGRTVAYVLHGTKFEEREIVERRRNGDRILLASGLRPGDRVAMKDPTVKE